MKFGAHVSIAGGIEKAPKRAYLLGCECFQIFTRSPRGGRPSRLDKYVLDKFFEECEKFNFADYYVHTPYFINLASKNEDVRNNSINLIREDLERASSLKAESIMTHLGSSKNMIRQEAIDNVIDSVKKILKDYGGSAKLLLENSAGQGDTVGDKLEEIGEIIKKVKNEDLGVCIDTAHLFGAGYDLRDKRSLNQTIGKISNTVGLDKVKLIHGNDSKVSLGEKKDRHEYIGEGKIGIEGFKEILKSEALININMIIENPPEGVSKDIKLLKEIRDK